MYMEAFYQHLKSPDFLIFGIAMGLVLNVVASYLRDFLDRSYSSGSSLLRGLSKRSRDKRAAREQQISEWIDTRENGAVIALIEANYLIVIGYMFLVVGMIACVAGLTQQAGTQPILKQLPFALLALIPGLVGMGTASMGGQIRKVVNKHPSGLVGLHRSKAGEQ
jgi:hypothetical protein